MAAVELHYKKIGEGQPFVILHGLMGAADNWQSLAKKWAENHTVYMVDQRNHGHSPHSEDFGFEVMVEDLKSIFDKENIQDAILLGHSMGGKTAMSFALEYPERLAKLIVVDIGTKAYPPHHQPIFEGLASVDIQNVETRKDVDDQLATKIPDMGVRMFLMKNLYWKEKGQLAWRFNLPVLMRDYEMIIDDIPDEECGLPTLFVRGDKSGYIKDADWPDIKLQFPNAELVTMTNAGHWVHAEKPKELFEAVNLFKEGKLDKIIF